MKKTGHQRRTTHLGVEEDLRSKKSLIADVHRERLLRDGVLALMNLDPLGRLRVVLGELFHDVRTHIRVLLLHSRSILTLAIHPRG